MSIRIPHTASLADNRLLTTTNGTLVDGTSTGPYHRFMIDIQTGGTGVVQWSSTGVGSVSAMNVWGSPRKTDNDRLRGDLNPLTNFLWGPQFPAGFIDTASNLSIPDGAATSGALLFSGLGHLTLLVEMIVAVDIPRFTLDQSGKDSA